MIEFQGASDGRSFEALYVEDHEMFQETLSNCRAFTGASFSERTRDIMNATDPLPPTVLVIFGAIE